MKPPKVYATTYEAAARRARKSAARLPAGPVRDTLLSNAEAVVLMGRELDKMDMDTRGRVGQLREFRSGLSELVRSATAMAVGKNEGFKEARVDFKQAVADVKQAQAGGT